MSANASRSRDYSTWPIFNRYVAACVLFFVSVFWILLHREALQEPPWQSGRAFDNPYQTLIGPDGNLLVYDIESNGAIKFMQIDPQGNLLWSLQGRQRGFDGFYDLRRFIVTDESNIYAINMITDVVTEKVNEYRLIKIERDTHHIRTLTTLYLPKNSQENANAGISCLWLEGGDLYYVVIEDNFFFHLGKVHLADGKMEQLSRHRVDKKIVTILGRGPTQLYISHDDASLTHLSREGKLTPVLLKDLDHLNLWPINVDKEMVVTVNELLSQTLYKLTEQGDGKWLLSEIASSSRIAAHPAFHGVKPLFFEFSRGSDGIIAAQDKVSHQIVLLNPDGSLRHVIGQWHYPPVTMVVRICVWIALLLVLTLVLGGAYHLYYHIYRRRMLLLMKMIFVFTPIVALSISAVAFVLFSHYEERILAEEQNRLMFLAHIGVSMISGDDVALLTKLSDIRAKPFARIRRAMEFFNGAGSAPKEWNSGLKAYIYNVREDAFLLSDACGVDFLVPETVPEAARETIKDGKIRIARHLNRSTDKLSAFGAIHDSKGKVVGIYEVARDLSVYREMDSAFLKQLMGGIALAEAIFVALFAIFIFLLLRSLATLRKFAEQVTQQDYDSPMAIASKDEVQDLANSLQRMAREVKRHIGSIEGLRDANSRFVPTEFLSLLGKSSIVDVKPGDQMMQTMTIMFADIRSFTTLSETMTPQENFDFLNDYLRQIGPVIRQHNGFITRYLGDGIIALFGGSPRDAVACAIGIHQELARYNLARTESGRLPVEIGIGLHRDRLMLGVVGDSARLDGAVVAEALELVCELESHTKFLGAKIVGSSALLDDAGGLYGFAFHGLSSFQPEGSGDPISVIEVLLEQSDPTEKEAA